MFRRLFGLKKDEEKEKIDQQEEDLKEVSEEAGLEEDLEEETKDEDEKGQELDNQMLETHLEDDKPVEAESEIVEELEVVSVEPVEEEEKEEAGGIFSGFLKGLSKTRENLSKKIDSVLGSFTKIDEDLFEMLEDTLIMADVGASSTMEIIDRLREDVRVKNITDPGEIKGELNTIVKEFMVEKGVDNKMDLDDTPLVILVVGVNGVGKTTSIGKLAHTYKKMGKSVLLGAADTFRAAAIDQLGIWADRVGVDMIAHQEGSDPGAVVFDTISAGKARGADIIICDTAGRLHNKKNLMNELEKIYRIIDSNYEEARVETLLVLDATTGQNAVNQAVEFDSVTNITGIIITKMDGTAKGGVVLRLQREMGLPIKYIGLGEGIEDLMEFDTDYFVDSIIS